jgi:hypothetical protein
MQYLREANCVTDAVIDKVKTYLSNTQVDPNVLNLKKGIFLKYMYVLHYYCFKFVEIEIDT